MLAESGYSRLEMKGKMMPVTDPKLAGAMGRLGTESAFVVLARAKQLEAQGNSIVHLEIGEPDFETPSNIVEAGVKALREGWTHYGPSHGLPEFKEAIADNVNSWRGTDYLPSEVLVTPGAKPIMFYAIMALCGPGDEVVYPDPGFPIYRSMIEYIGATPVPMPLLADNEFRLDVDRFRADLNDKTRLVILNSPSNPTGGYLPKEDIESIAECVLNTGAMVLTDEVYKEITYDIDHFSIASVDGLRERTILLDGFSKSYSMTGWRLGYSVGPQWIIDAMAQLQTNAVSCTASFVQMAGIEALKGPQDQVATMTDTFRERRDLIVGMLNEIEGVSCLSPQGAFYAFPQLNGFRQNEEEIADILLDEGGVATLAGTAFGKFGSGSLRLSFANSTDNLIEAASRIGQTLDAIR